MPVMDMAELAPATKTLVNDVCDRCNGRLQWLSNGQKWYLGCGNCWHPAPADHPDQIRLTQQYEEKEKLDKEEEGKRQKVESDATTAKSVGMLALVEERFDNIEKRLSEQGPDAQVGSLHEALVEIGKRMDQQELRSKEQDARLEQILLSLAELTKKQKTK